VDKLKLVETAPSGLIVAGDNDLLLGLTLEDVDGLIRMRIMVTCCTALEGVSSGSK
jgi:hypothetical protein